MKKVTLDKLEQGESYLCDTGFGWSPSGFDIAEFDRGELISQSNGSDIIDVAKIIYKLPINH
ncbi:MAG: hypothetical protein KA981_11625 [Bacteroidia bacterium]|nr:hypothetical protein [Bacteroidia bacterium]